MLGNVRSMKTAAELALADAFVAAQPTLPGDGKIAAWRQEAFARFSDLGLPHRRVEAWRYTDLRSLLRDVKPLANPPSAEAKARAAGAGSILGNLECRRLVFVDGSFVPELSDLVALEPGLAIQSMASALTAGDPVTVSHLGRVFPVRDAALEINAALMGDGIIVRVAANTVLKRPLHVVFATVAEAPAAMFVRSLVIVEHGARAQLFESHQGSDSSAYQVNVALELVIGEGASVEHVKIVDESGAAFHVASLLATLGAGAALDDFAFIRGGAVVRNQLFLRLAGECAVAAIRGANLLSGRQHVDSTLVVDHVVGHCETRELFKSVLDGEAHGVFQGKIIVQPNAQKSDAKMMSRALLLSERAEAIHKPELEIFADDVQCGHGATTGALDEDLKFYLMARGIPAKEAEALLIAAFIAEPIDAIADEGVRTALLDAAAAWLRKRG